MAVAKAKEPAIRLSPASREPSRFSLYSLHSAFLGHLLLLGIWEKCQVLCPIDSKFCVNAHKTPEFSTILEANFSTVFDVVPLPSTKGFRKAKSVRGLKKSKEFGYREPHLPRKKSTNMESESRLILVLHNPFMLQSRGSRGLGEFFLETSRFASVDLRRKRNGSSYRCGRPKDDRGP